MRLLRKVLLAVMLIFLLSACGTNDRATIASAPDTPANVAVSAGDGPLYNLSPYLPFSVNHWYAPDALLRKALILITVCAISVCQFQQLVGKEGYESKH